MEAESDSSASAINNQIPSTPSSVSEQPLSSPSTNHRTSSLFKSNGLLGKHRLTAAISNLQNEINFLQGELEQLESFGESSIVCKEVISSVEPVPDPLLPWIRGPSNISWERWFTGAHNSRKRWI